MTRTKDIKKIIKNTYFMLEFFNNKSIINPIQYESNIFFLNGFF